MSATKDSIDDALHIAAYSAVIGFCTFIFKVIINRCRIKQVHVPSSSSSYSLIIAVRIRNKTSRERCVQTISIREIVNDTYTYLLENGQFELIPKRKNQYYSAIKKIYVLLANILKIADSGPYSINQQQKEKLIKIVVSKIKARFGRNAFINFMSYINALLRPRAIANNAQALATSIIKELQVNVKYKDLNLFIAEEYLLISLQEIFSKNFDEKIRTEKKLAEIEKQECSLISKGEYSKRIGDIKQEFSPDELQCLLLTDEQYLILALKRALYNASHVMLLENAFKTRSQTFNNRSIVHLILDMCDHMNKSDRIKSEEAVPIFEVENSFGLPSYKKRA